MIRHIRARREQGSWWLVRDLAVVFGLLALLIGGVVATSELVALVTGLLG